MNIDVLSNVLLNKRNRFTPITVHTGGDNWEEIVEVVYCDECKQYHIISERVKDGDHLK
jgi:hypothetical protein